MTLQDKIDLEKRESFNEGKSEGRQEGIEIGEARGEARGRETILYSMLADGEITISSAAKRLNITEEEFEQKYKAYQSSDR